MTTPGPSHTFGPLSSGSLAKTLDADVCMLLSDGPCRRGPFTVAAELWFQPIGYRWAMNLAEYDAFETERFLRYYREMAAGSALLIGSAKTSTR